MEGLFYLLNNYDKANINKGAKLYQEFSDYILVDGIEQDDDIYTLQVPSQSSNSVYSVEINIDDGADACLCPAFGDAAYCKHVVAAAFHLLINYFDQDILALEKKYHVILQTIGGKPKATKPEINLDPHNDEWKKITSPPHMLLINLSLQARYNFDDYLLKQTVKIVEANEQTLHWKFSVIEKKQEYFPEIIYNKNDTYQYRCTCKQTANVCSHVKAVFDATLGKQNDFFLKHKDWLLEKQNLLKPYGVTLDDSDAGFFEFIIEKDGTLTLKPPSFIWKMGAEEKFNQLKQLLAPAKNKRPALTENTFIDFETGFLLNLTSKRLNIGFELEPIKVIHKTTNTIFNKLSVHLPANFPLLKSLPNNVYETVTALSETAIKTLMHTTGQMGYIHNLQQLTGKQIAFVEDYYFTQLQKLWPWLVQQPMYVLRTGNFVAVNIRPASLSATAIKPAFTVVQEGHYITIQIFLELEGQQYSTSQFVFHKALVVEVANVFYLPSANDRQVLKQFENGFIKMHESDKPKLMRDIVPYLQKEYSVSLPANFNIEKPEILPKPQLLLKEYGDQYLMLQPQFDYDGTVVGYDHEPEDIFQLDSSGNLQAITRNTTIEKDFFESLRPLHTAFERQRANEFFYLPFADVMKSGWFLKTISILQQQNIAVLGIKDLKKFKYNTHTPKWEMKAGSGIDWFDLKIEITFGDQTITLPEVRKAVLSGQNVVVLGDGTFGMLPETWLQQYGMLLKMGDAQKDGTLRISKLHYTLIDELHGEIDDEEVLQEIEDKKQKLHNINNIATIKPSKQIKAKHRHYQLSGFQWMQVLDEVGWGGCLADDMGLGKTLQAITFLQYLKEKHIGSTHLVVCPTSLIYNWEIELKKFAPSLKYHIYYGSDRDFSDEHFENYDLVLTSYGVLRLDIQHLMTFSWHYIILDESQSIKNPEAQVTKALQLLKSRNRLILSGTPVQNNTLDLFAQFNFINPGLLGTRDFFKTEFANPIDKHNDADKSARLRRLVYPFLLRRTKEQVATDLPDKTEIILWCTMPKDQRAVYDHYKDYYRKMVLEVIAEEGLAKAGIYVLEGLLRLRQICDSPQLLKAPDIKTVTSIKTQELLREIKENTGQHKLLVFSQFTEMLAIIKEGLEAESVPYCYLDGSTPAIKRQEAVAQFQTDATYKVFLISLKAGGVGLNLTAADYVYLVDPWWNPAVEQQAIDRTHRIGQSQKIFAYKMICKDTVEEKILQLQSRKKRLANDLVTEYAGFMKKLQKEDVEFLFS